MPLIARQHLLRHFYNFHGVLIVLQHQRLWHSDTPLTRRTRF
jgi:hypothetical protein